ncbi:MAG: class I SAM-dependent methyltransferase [Pontixanthobacter sp.]
MIEDNDMHIGDYGWAAHAPHSSQYLNPVVLELVQAAGGQTVLDAGCGNGELAGYLASHGYRLSGVDADAEGIAIARRRFPDCNFAVSRFSKDPKAVFDLVVSTEVVEHLYAPHELANYCFDALRPGGTFIISTPYHGYFKNLALALSGRWGRHLAPNWHGGHIKFWDRQSLTGLLVEAGFVVTGFRGVGRMPLLWKSMVLIARKPG